MQHKKHKKLFSKLFILIIFLALLFILLVPLKSPFNFYDEGFANYNADRIINGEIPYKDFWTIYSPGQFYVLALVFKIWGSSLLVSRIYDTVLRFIIIILFYFLAKKITNNALALFSIICVTILLASLGSYSYAVFPALVFGLFSLLCFDKYLNTQKLKWLLITGIFIGISQLFRWDIGLYVFISIELTLFFFNYFHRKDFNKKIFYVILPSLILAGIVTFIIVSVLMYWVFNGSINEFWRQVVVFPITTQQRFRRLPYPTILPSFHSTSIVISNLAVDNNGFMNWLRFYFPFLINISGIIWFIFLLLKKRNLLTVRSYLTGTIIFLGSLLFLQAVSRYDYVHVVPSTIIAFLIVVIFVYRVVNPVKSKFLKSLFYLILFAFIYIYFLSPVKVILAINNDFAFWNCYSKINKAGCVYLSHDQESVINYINNNSRHNEPIFVGNKRHDIILVSDVGLYFLIGHPSATKYRDLFPGLATTHIIQEEIIKNIELKKVKLILLVDNPISLEPNASAISSEVYILDDYIRSRYTLIKKFGNYEVWGRL